MITSEELDQFLQQAMADKAAEPAFFRALLDASVYAHVPRVDRLGQLRFIQFTTPDGLTVVPFFIDEMQARVASGPGVSIVALTGRQLFMVTRGATLMLNPNETSCLLYPEEISALLDHGQVAIVQRVDTGEQHLRIGPPSTNPKELIERLVALYANMGSIQAGYLVEIGGADEAEDRRLLIAAAVPSGDAERVARATMAEIQVHSYSLQMAVDFTAFDPGSPPDWLKETRLQPFYVHAVGSAGLH